MTNKNKLVKSINKDFDKNNNYNSIIGKIQCSDNKKSFIKYATIPMIFIIVISLALLNNKNNNPLKNQKNIETSTSRDGNNYNGLNTYSSSNIIINEINELAINSNDFDGKIQNEVYIPYFEFLSNLKVPTDFDNKEDMRIMWVKSNPSSNEYDVLNHYQFHLKNTKSNREFIISFSNKYKIFRCVNLFANDYPKSVINGVNVLIVKGSNYYVSVFSYKGYNFDVEGIDVTEKEFINLLESLIT